MPGREHPCPESWKTNVFSKSAWVSHLLLILLIGCFHPHYFFQEYILSYPFSLPVKAYPGFKTWIKSHFCREPLWSAPHKWYLPLPKSYGTLSLLFIDHTFYIFSIFFISIWHFSTAFPASHYLDLFWVPPRVYMYPECPLLCNKPTSKLSGL